MATTETTAGPGSFIASAGRRTLGYGQMLVADIDAAIFGTRPRIDGKPVETNTPAFAIGHLALYPARIIELLGGDPGATRAPEGWEDLFKAGVDCHDDPDNTRYPGKEALVGHFVSASETALAAIEAAEPSVFAREMPIERYREFFPTVGDGVNFLAGPHAMAHLGQISAWRRCMGLGGVM